MKKLATMVLTLLTAANIFAVAPAAALIDGSKGAICKGIALSDTADCSSAYGQADRANGLISRGLNLFSAIIGIIAVVMIIIAGLKYTTSQGDAAQVNSAKNTALYAAIGLVIAALSQLIVRFVINKFS